MDARVILPDNIIVKQYDLEIEPNLDEFTFQGHVDIHYQVVKQDNTKCITLNSRDLVIKSGSIGNKKAIDIQFDTSLHRVTFVFDFDLNASNVLHVEFNGVLNDNLVGFYRSKYLKNDQVKYMAVTQFAANDARRCFPCMDEPALKAVFTVRLIIPKELTALSNTTIVNEIDHHEKKLVVFEPTPLMSTYLLAFAVGEFDYVERKAENGINIRVITQLNRSNQGLFALDIAVKVLPLLEQYFKIKYPLEKLDLLAVPDMSFGGMENFGLITFRENALLVDPVNTSAHIKQRVALIVSHEITHQWFGNLTTMFWWNALWLNEATATYFQYYCVDLLHPEWNVFEQFVHSEFERAQNLDGLASSHPIEVEIRNATEVDDAFDAISYAKGSVIIRMLASFMGAEQFAHGISTYLQKFKYGNATTNDLWSVLSEVSGKDIKSIMNSWTTQTGYPVLIIEENGTELTVKQYRYLDSGIQFEDQSLWQIPFSYITSSNTNNPIFQTLTERTSSIQLQVDTFEWIKFNPGQTGFYRVFYPDSYIQKLIPAIKTKQLNAIDRLSIQDDICSLAQSGVIAADKALSILSAYSDENNYTVWSSIVTKLDNMYVIVKHDPIVLQQFMQFARLLMSKQRDILGWEKQENESHLQTMLRALIINALVKFGDPQTIGIATQKFQHLMTDPSSVPPDLRSAVMFVGVHRGGELEYNQVLQLYETTTLQEEKQRCLKALAMSRDASLIDRTLKLALDESFRSMDVVILASFMADNPMATIHLWNWLTSNITYLKQKYDGTILYGRLIKACTAGLTSYDQLQQVRKFFESHEHRSLSSNRSIDQAIEAVKTNVEWLARSHTEIAEYFNN
jgi:puromycin-sensitive aminopeptidase